ncbi:MAG: polyprenyl synthetase family protein [Planctomycetota bacterium]|nr:polyprenyl synthetase family protein [Planctomycetota bacterium]
MTRTAQALPEVLGPVRADLERVRLVFRSILADVGVHSGDMVRDAASFNGKRLRPGLTCVAGRIACGRVTDSIATVAAIIELIHTATLVHDDIIDSAAVRRNVPTLNARWGTQAAVLVGDVLFSKAYRAAAYLDDPFASRYLSDVVGEVLEGEIHQDQVAQNPDLTEDTYRRIIRGKTAALYEAALRVGAHYGGASAEVGDALAAYGHHLGMAFQIVDDRLDVTGDEHHVGKTLGTDLAEGKTTLPVILWQRGLSDAERIEARDLLERAWDDRDAAREVGRRLRASGALERADAAAAAEVDAALAALAPVPVGQERTLLETLAGFVLRRTR